jgi:type I restriction enzyme S subunit
MSEWKEYKLGEIVELNYGKGLTENKRMSGNVPVYSSAGITGWHNEPLVNSEGLIIGRKGTIGKVYYSNAPFFCIDTAYYILPNEERYDLKFLFYKLKTLGLEDLNEDSAVPGLNRETVYSQDISLPGLPEQKAIASILSSLDDKIDLLHRQNATLEKMAETLFRQWFVERRPEPVEGKAKEEWEEGKVSDYALHLKDSIQPQKNPSTFYFHYSISSFDNGRIPITKLGEEVQSNKYKVQKNCILFSKLNPHKEKRVWLLQDEVEENSICSTEFQVIFPKNKQHLYFLYGWLTFNENYNEIACGVGGTSGSHQRIDPKTIFEFQCPLISDSVIENFNVKIKPIFKKQVINQIQIRTLMALRDTLLPKLMSGEIRVL